MLRFFLAAMTLLTVVGLGFAMYPRGGIMLVDPRATAEIWDPVPGGVGAVDGVMRRGDAVYFCNEGGGCLQRWRPAEGLVTLCGRDQGTPSPEDLVVAPDGTVFFTDDDAGGLWMVAPEGGVQCVAGKQQGLVSTEGIALCPDGSLLVGDGHMHRIYRVTRQGDVSIFLDGAITKPESMAFDEQGNLYVADNVEKKVYQIDPGRHVRVLLDTHDGLSSPETLCVCGGTLYLSDPVAGKIFRYTPTKGLETLAALAGRLKNVQGVTADEQGTLLATVQDLKHRQGFLLRIGLGAPCQATADQ